MESGVSKGKNQLKTMNSPVYRYWSALYMSFYSKRLYVDVGKRWNGFGVLYLLLVFAVFSIPFAVKLSDKLNVAFKEQITDPLSKIPVFYIQNGEVSFDKPMPYMIKNDKNQVLVIIDTTGKITQFTEAYPYLTILINKNIMYIKVPSPQLFNMSEQPPNMGTPISQSFGKGANLVFDGKKLVKDNTMSGMKYASQLMIYPMIVCIFFSIFIIIFLVLALMGELFSNIFFSFKINYKKSCRLLIVAATPMLFVFMLMLTMNKIVPGLGIVLFILLIASFGFALYSLKAESKQVVVP